MGVCWGQMEKLKPHYALADIQAAFEDPDRLNRTWVSKRGVDDLGLDDAAVVAVIQGLTRADFDKSMTSFSDHKVWQDVYKADTGGRTAYIKFTLDAHQAFLLISFKEA
jgi:motility quorum-sensing regulator / GCU-specific mRNA interferase toxin